MSAPASPTSPPPLEALKAEWAALQATLGASARHADDPRIDYDAFLRPFGPPNIALDAPGYRPASTDVAGATAMGGPAPVSATDLVAAAPLRRVGGLDISFVPNSPYAVASLVILDVTSHEGKKADAAASASSPPASPPAAADITGRKQPGGGGDAGAARYPVIYEDMLHCEMRTPYIPRFLAFREVEPLRALIKRMRERLNARDHPQVYFIDGNGLLHPRRCGLASHLGVLEGIPVVGCAKNMLAVDGLGREYVERLFAGLAAARSGSAAAAAPGGSAKALRVAPLAAAETTAAVRGGGGGIRKGSGGDGGGGLRRGGVAKAVGAGGPSALTNVLVPLVGASGALWGYAALTGNSTANPIFISSGHLISPLTAARLALALAVHRVVEPVRQADLRSRQYISDNSALWS